MGVSPSCPTVPEPCHETKISQKPDDAALGNGRAQQLFWSIVPSVGLTALNDPVLLSVSTRNHSTQKPS